MVHSIQEHHQRERDYGHSTAPQQIERDEQGNLRLKIGGDGKRIDIASFSADGARLLTVQEAGVAQIWDALSGQLISEIRPDSPLAGLEKAPFYRPFKVFIESAILSPDGTQALFGLNDGTAGIFDIASGQRLNTLYDPNLPPASRWEVVRAVAYDSVGERVAVGFLRRAVGVWDSRTGRCLAFLRDPLAERPTLFDDGPRPTLISTVAFSADSRYLFAGASDGIITIWDLTTQQPIFNSVAHTERIIALSMDGATVRWATNGGNVWEAEVGQPGRCILSTQARWEEAALEPNGASLLARTPTEAQHWNLKTGMQIRPAVAISFGRLSRSRALAYTPDGTCHVFPHNTHLLTLSGANTDVTLFCEYSISRVSFSPNGKILVTTGGRSQVELWSVPDGSCLAVIPEPGNSGSPAISRDG